MARADRNMIDRLPLAGALALAALCASCGSFGDPLGYAVVTQDRYDFMTCKEIIGHRSGLINREKELLGLVEKAESGPGGFIVGAAAYRSELGQTRTLLRVAHRAAEKNGCDAGAKP